MSYDSLTDSWAPTVHKLCHNQDFCGFCDAQFLCLSTVQQQFHTWRSDNSDVLAHSQSKLWNCRSQRAPAQCVASPSWIRVPPHNADTTGIWCTVRDTALR
ncbi:hypothetical protein AVEN_199448-1 [Araneus ventricosus]|uniref:Uncharacterized protein n=1 Tax=Araneus ventricosus TaxID=182803 RepID=A0A4Y2W5U6_ARAVE|nr:hypothetical protein AVEN_245843-1 [Araneus ventricosus]GBO32390.1 hypothetical protein AVEN_253654-1 [Araneus ventricosus]GBO32392.1 hypothetical protein AVEN_22065-1 [Araneus ventricosus]GBO32396.1 hypothetical protein AVEN_132777-1 [Araneus ventricosus]GBO34639.1 hypothetical protein AVEN_199448-1 [Araneus ventricosus]